MHQYVETIYDRKLHSLWEKCINKRENVQHFRGMHDFCDSDGVVVIVVDVLVPKH